METLTENQTPVKFTSSAITEIKNLYKKGNYATGFGLRIGVEGGGCAGFSYILDFDHKKENDTVYFIDEIPLYIDNTQALYLYNCNIDFKNGLENRGFIYDNPNATSTCGCGTSFSA